MSAIRISKKGFTLIEILIVVIILGILAAIVIPQFSSATTQAKTSAVSSTAQSVRTQIALYKLQHNDQLPPAAGANFWTKYMVAQTDTLGTAWTNSAANIAAGGPWGPYMQAIPTNPLNGQGSTVLDSAATPGTAAASATAWVYDLTGGTGKFYGTGTDGVTVQP